MGERRSGGVGGHPSELCKRWAEQLVIHACACPGRKFGCLLRGFFVFYLFIFRLNPLRNPWGSMPIWTLSEALQHGGIDLTLLIVPEGLAKAQLLLGTQFRMEILCSCHEQCNFVLTQFPWWHPDAAAGGCGCGPRSGAGDGSGSVSGTRGRCPIAEHQRK